MSSSTLNETVAEIDKKSSRSFNWLTNWKFTISGIIIIIVLLLAGLSYYQATRFNAKVMINDTNVGGLTADQAMKKLESSVLKNQVFVGKVQILDEKDTKTGFTKQDLQNVKKVLKKQWTFFPAFNEKKYSLLPSKVSQYRSQTLKKQVEDKLIALNKSLKAPQDATVRLTNGKIDISKSIDGTQYDVASLLKDYQKQELNSEIQLNPVYIQPIRETSQIIKKEEKMLQDLVQRTVDYEVQNQVYALNASEIIKNASLSKDMQYTIDPAGINNKIAAINSSQSTLNKTYQFKTHAGSIVSVKGQSYGWALNVSAEAKRVQEAFLKGEKSVSATNIYGSGYSTYGIGYNTALNNGIGGTYVEVSIQQQRIWIYRNGQLVLTTNVVTGNHSTQEDTPPGVWYIMYKESPSILEGTSEAHHGHYSVKVSYWAPFTLSGCGFHDASWRSNWSSNAYLHAGSGGCVNTPPSIMRTVYNNLSQNEPVVIY